MKAIILSGLHFKMSKNFEKEVQKLIPEGIKEVCIYAFQMKWKGYGQYDYSLRLTIDGEDKEFKWHTNDSQSYDFWKNRERDTLLNNFEKRRILSLLEQYQDELNEMCYEVS